MIGRFDYRRDCSIPHHMPPGEMADGYPVVVFPQENHKVVPGNTYEFHPALTRQAQYVIDGVTYRVAHAVAPREVEGKEAGLVDELVHTSSGNSRPATIADTPAGAALAQLKAALSG